MLVWQNTYAVLYNDSKLISSVTSTTAVSTTTRRAMSMHHVGHKWGFTLR